MFDNAKEYLVGIDGNPSFPNDDHHLTRPRCDSAEREKGPCLSGVLAESIFVSSLDTNWD